MKRMFLEELKINLKALLIWSIAVGIMGFSCILLFQSMEGEIQGMADAFSNMGAFSDAFGMSTLSIASIEGFFATEVGTVHGLGGAMFAAILAIGIISKEEEGHTGEFTFSFPVSRKKVVAAKGLCVLIMLTAFTVICTLLYLLGFKMLGEEPPMGDFMTFMLRQYLMNIEIGGICFGISALSGKNRTGLGIGLAMVFYFYDVIGRVVPDLKDYLFIGPFSYANASEIFSGKEAPAAAFVMAAVLVFAGVLSAFVCIDKRDLAS
ncbi:MAG: ABC transporter permease [Lachnospiraceae bacterium]|nr:ABC transporter permease [Lachnospiraceae bacterium]